MEKTIITLITLLMGAAQSYAVTGPQTETHRLAATLTQLYVGHDTLAHVESGRVQVDPDKKIVQLILQEKAVVIPSEIVIEVPLVSTTTDSCGVVMYTGESDKSIIDGLYEKIEVMDFSKSICMYIIKTSTTVNYESFNPLTQKNESSQFEADMLLPSPTLLNPVQ